MSETHDSQPPNEHHPADGAAPLGDPAGSSHGWEASTTPPSDGAGAPGGPTSPPYPPSPSYQGGWQPPQGTWTPPPAGTYPGAGGDQPGPGHEPPRSGQPGYPGQPDYPGQPGYPGRPGQGGQAGRNPWETQGQPGGPTPPWGSPPGDYPQGGGYPGGGYPYWQQQTPPAGSWSGSGGAWGPGGPGGPASPGGGWYEWGSDRPRRTLPSTVIALLLAVAVIVGLGIGHGVWTSARSTSAALPNGSSGSGNSSNPFGNSGNSGNSGGATNPFGSGGSNFFGGGSSGSGNGALSGVAAKVANELVDINTDLSYQNGQAAGTGIVLSADGYVLTNNHVISGATSIRATDIGNGQQYRATVVGYDRTHDVAVIKLANASNLQVASFGDSSKLSVGQWVDGLGNAGGVGGTPSSASGQIEQLNQSITAQDDSNGTQEKLTGLIQTNADIQPGDSGGSLINSSGQVIGMDTAASTGFSFQTQSNEGFAIPINQALSIATRIRGGQASADIHIGRTAFLGVAVAPQQNSTTKGAVVAQQGAIANTAAAKAGIAAGDVITSLGGSTIDSPTTLTNVIGRYHPGDQVVVVWTTPSGQTQQATVTLGNGPAA